MVQQSKLDTSSAQTAPIASQGSAALTLTAMCLALFMTNFDGAAGDVALPNIQRSLETNMSGVQWFLNAYHLPVASLLLFAGKLGDVLGRKRIFLSGLTLFTLASVLCGITPNLTLLIVGRALQGIGAAALIPLSLTIVTVTFTDEASRTKAIGIWSAVSAIALVAGPGLGGLFVDSLSWRSIFFFNVPIGMLTFLLTLSAFKEKQTQQANPDWLGLILSVLAIASLAYSLTAEGAGPWLSSYRLSLLALSAFWFALFFLKQSRSHHPVIPLSLTTNRRFTLLCTAQMLVFFMSGGLFFILSLFLQHVQGYSAVMTGLCFLPMNGAIIAASFGSGWIAAKLGWRFPLLSGLTIMALTVISLTSISAATDYSEILGKLIIAGFGGGLVIPTLAATLMNAVPPRQEGIASALSSVSIEFGGILGIAVQGAVFSEQMRETLQQTFLQWQFSEALSASLLSNALQLLSEVPRTLPVSAEAVQEAVRLAFVSGLQSVLWVAASAIALGIVLVISAPNKPHKQTSTQTPISE